MVGNIAVGGGCFLAEVFISYSRDDEAVARRVAKGLQTAGLEVWWDADLPAHRSYSDVIERNLEDARAVVVLWSQTAAKSQWVRAEADFARTAGKLVQARVDGALPPMPFNQIQCADLKTWRGSQSHKGWLKLQSSVKALVSGQEQPAVTKRAPALRDRLRPYRWWAAVAGALLAFVAAWLLTFGVPGGERKTVLAVLPFTSLDARDESLVAGIWEDTRSAISRNPNLVVLGPNTSEQLATEKDSSTRKAADYLLEASVRSVGDRIRVSTNLVRTKDGAQVWSEKFDRKLDDVFALQSQIAQEIEGRVRGRLATSGGRQPENIATSGEVYALYSDARAKIRKREMEKYEQAFDQLLRVVQMDPNFAPGWATLAVIKAFEVRPSVPQASTAEQDARRAIALAPNLATGHAALGFALRQGPVAQASLRRALSLDPGDFEAMNWLASALAPDQTQEKLKLYDRIVEIEPLWWPVVLNRLNLLLKVDDRAAVDEELTRLDRLGDRILAMRARMQTLGWRGDYSEAVKIGLAVYRHGSQADRERVRDILAELLLQLDYSEEAFMFSHAPPGAGSVWRNEPGSLDMIDALKVPPAAFWKNAPMTEGLSHAYLAMGRSARLVQYYKDGAGSPERLLAEVNDPTRFVFLAPLVSLALKQAGEPAEAERLLTAAEQILAGPVLNRVRGREHPLYIARVRAVQGRLPEAAAALRQAVDRGWLPPAPYFKPDLQADPALGLLKELPQFQQTRSRILEHMARERVELGPTLAAVRAAAPGR